MIKEIKTLKYQELKEKMEFEVSSGYEEPLTVKVAVAVSDELISKQNKMYFRAKITESLVSNSIYIDFNVTRKMPFEDKINKVKQHLSVNPHKLAILFNFEVL